MKNMIIYLDNYRGFTEQFIETSDLNILVGENSTGKSSFLSILCLLSHPDFLTKANFKNEFVDLGPFDEIINIGGSRKTLQLGVINSSEGDSLYAGDLDAVLLKFSAVSGYPKIVEVLIVKGKDVLWYESSLGKVDSLSYVLYNMGSGKRDLKKLFCDFSKSSKVTLNVMDSGRLKAEDGIGSFMSRYFYSIIYFIQESAGTKKKELYKNFGLGFALESGSTVLKKMTWVAPIRSEPKRIYEPSEDIYSADGTHVPNVLREIYNSETKANIKTLNTLTKFGVQSGLFEELEITDYIENKELSPFELNIILSDRKLRITNVGYGVSQALPIITEVIRSDRGSGFLIQQPEVHLHPKAQAFMGEFLFSECVNSNKKFFVETHSDYLIDRIRTEIRKSRKKDIEKKVVLMFFERSEAGNSVTRIEIDKDGNIDPNQPESYRDFFLKEQLNILGYSSDE